MLSNLEKARLIYTPGTIFRPAHLSDTSKIDVCIKPSETVREFPNGSIYLIDGVTDRVYNTNRACGANLTIFDSASKKWAEIKNPPQAEEIKNVLPANWGIKVTAESYALVKDIRPLNFPKAAFGCSYFISRGYGGLSWGACVSGLPTGFSEIPLETFKKEVLKLSPDHKTVKVGFDPTRAVIIEGPKINKKTNPSILEVKTIEVKKRRII